METSWENFPNNDSSHIHLDTIKITLSKNQFPGNTLYDFFFFSFLNIFLIYLISYKFVCIKFKKINPTLI